MNLYQSLAHQFRKPSGLIGLWTGSVMRKWNNHKIEMTLEELHIQPTDHVLEIGYGPGEAVAVLAQKITTGHICGIDFSPLMYKKARKRNKDAIASGTVELLCDDAASLPYPDAAFDRVFAINVIYFWKDPKLYLREIMRVLKPGGTLALYIMTDRNPINANLDVFTHYTDTQATELLQSAGLKNFRTKNMQSTIETGFCILAEK